MTAAALFDDLARHVVQDQHMRSLKLSRASLQTFRKSRLPMYGSKMLTWYEMTSRVRRAGSRALLRFVAHGKKLMPPVNASVVG